MTTSRFGRLAAATTAVLLLAACSPAAQQNNQPAATTSGSASASGEKVTVTVRVWDDQVQKAYDKSFAAFTQKNPNITVKTTLVPWAQYFDKLRTDIGGGNGDDIFMMNGSYIEPYIKNNNLIEVGSDFESLKAGWLQAAIDQYTFSGKLWGIPQLTDGGIAIYYNKDLLTKAGLTPADLDTLKWTVGGGAGDTLISTAKKLTVDAAGKPATDPAFNGAKPGTWGYSAAQDLQGIYYNFIGSNGGAFQDDQNNFTFASSESEAAFQYIVDLINKYKVAPAADNTNSNGDFNRDQFLQGKIALFQSGVYNLKNVSDGAKFAWGIAPLPEGPKGRVSVVNNTIVAGNAASKHKDATIKVMQWLGSPEGAKFIGADGAAIPAVKDAASAFNDFWKAKNVDPSQFAKAGEGPSTRAPGGGNYGAAFNAWKPTFDEIFLGRAPVTDLKKAQDAANAAMKG